MKEKTILIVDENQKIASKICRRLKQQGMDTSVVYNWEEAKSMLKQKNINYLLIDIVTPETEQFTKITEFYEKCNCPIVVLVAKTNNVAIEEELDAEAEKNLTKICSDQEKFAMINSNLQRYVVLGGVTEEIPSVIQYYDLKLDMKAGTFFICDKEVELTSSEHKIIELLLRNPRRIFSVQQIYQYVFDEKSFNEWEAKNSVLLHISRLRKKIKSNSTQVKYIQTVRNRGYKLERGYQK